MAASHAVSGLSRAIGGRAVHLRLIPRIETIAESREILRLLQTFGPVEMFRSLKYDALPMPNAMIAIYKDEDSAKRLLKQSPLRFNMLPSEAEQAAAAAAAPEDRLSDDLDSLRNQESGEDGQQAQSQQRSAPAGRAYQLQVNFSTVHHRDQIAVNPYNGPFAVDSKSVVQKDLATRVPLVGLSDVNLRKAEKPWKVLDREREAGRRERVALRQLFEAAGS